MYFLIFFSSLLFGTFHGDQGKPELVCVRNNKAKKLCYYNFRLDGKNFHYTDVGCKYSRSKVLEKVHDGSLALAREWKVPCQ
ncbi:MAG: hypothetical protein OEU76_09765 [Cyclobacteriaceae bacterium]|nr:hypothetical protein [Cyclobacteriaceae bacterium]